MAWKFWRWSPALAALVIAPFFAIELIFLGANALKIPQGGWFPLLVGTGLFILMWTWRKGSRLLAEISHRGRPPLPEFIRMAESSSVPRVPGTAMFLTGNAQDVPAALLHNMKHNKVLHDHNIILTIVTEEVPRLRDEGRVTVEKLSDRFSRVIVRFGFMESPDVPKALESRELRPGGRVVLPVAAGAASVGSLGIAAVAGLHLHSARALRERRVRPLLHPGGSGGRSRRTDHDLITSRRRTLACWHAACAFLHCRLDLRPRSRPSSRSRRHYHGFLVLWISDPGMPPGLVTARPYEFVHEPIMHPGAVEQPMLLRHLRRVATRRPSASSTATVAVGPVRLP